MVDGGEIEVTRRVFVTQRRSRESWGIKRKGLDLSVRRSHTALRAAEPREATNIETASMTGKGRAVEFEAQQTGDGNGMSVRVLPGE